MNNNQNCLIPKEEVEHILNYYGPIGNNGEALCVNNLELYQKAFVHESYLMACKCITANQEPRMSELYLPEESNERLEFLGDNTMKYIMGCYLYERYTMEREGFLTKLKIKLEKTKTLHMFAVSHGFSKWLLLSEEVEAHTILSPESGRNTRSFYEDAFESFIGSLVLDNKDGVVYADRFVRNIIENNIDFSELITTNDNFKDSIQRYFQSNKWKTPDYIQLCESGPGYRRLFTRVLFIECSLLNSSTLMYSKLSEYSNRIVNSYKASPETYRKLFDKVSKGYLLLGIGTANKVVDSEQLAGRIALLNFDLPLDY